MVHTDDGPAPDKLVSPKARGPSSRVFYGCQTPLFDREATVRSTKGRSVTLRVMIYLSLNVSGGIGVSKCLHEALRRGESRGYQKRDYPPTNITSYFAVSVFYNHPASEPTA